MSTTYVTLRPHSSTNPSDKHLVVDYDTWCDYVNGDALSYTVVSRHPDARAAQAEIDRLVARVGDCQHPSDCRLPRCTC